MVTVSTGWRQDGTGPRGTLEAVRGWFLMVQAERESERSIRGKGVSERITGCYKFKEGPHRKQAFRRRDGQALQLAGT